MVSVTGPHGRSALREEHARVEWTRHGAAHLLSNFCGHRLVHVAGTGLVFHDLRFHLRGGLEFERTGFCDRGNGVAGETRADEAHRGPTSLSRPREIATRAGDA